MKWLTYWWFHKERGKLKGLDLEAIKEAQKIFGRFPLRNYLIALMDDMVRQGVYLPYEKQQGVLHTIETLKGEIEKGDQLIKREKT